MIFSSLLALAAERSGLGRSSAGTMSTFSGLIDRVIGILNDVVPLLIGVAVVVFLYGVLKFITSAGDETKRKEGKDVMIYGIIGLFVMVAVWGLVWILLNTFSLQTGTPPPIPKLK
ncbi:MAG: hypothetical protein HY773_02275 [Candidatus Terrybacteria bacterium]|nr:hypothetical protein [Candidatus Terrybacteria bacterium]